MSAQNLLSDTFELITNTVLHKTYDGWEIKKVLGSGAYGIVYLVSNYYSKETAVMKVGQSPDEYFEYEDRVLDCIINNSNIEDRTGHLVKKLDSGILNLEMKDKKCNLPYIVMEYLPGNPVEIIGALDPQQRTGQVLDFSPQLLKALYDLHQLGFIHRDIKPENIGIFQKNVLVLYDMGLARYYLTKSGYPREPRSYVGMRGTEEWSSLSAELGREQGRVDDLWGFLYCLNEWVNCQSSIPQAWSHFDGNPLIRQLMKSPYFPAHLVLNKCPFSFYRIQIYLRSLDVTDTPDYFYLASVLHEDRRAIKRLHKQSKIDNSNLVKEAKLLENLYF